MTLLEIYDQHLNGNKRAFYEAIKEYGETDFLIDIIEECKEGILSLDEIHRMKNTIKHFRG